VTQTAGGDGTDSREPSIAVYVRAIWMLTEIHCCRPRRTNFSLGEPLSGAAKKLSLGDISPSWSFWVDAFVGRKGDIAFTAARGATSELYYMAS